MIVERAVFCVKRGCMSELVALSKTGEELAMTPHGWRLYSIKYGANDSLAVEWEFESEAERDTYWDEWWASPQRPAFMEKWNELTKRVVGTERWNVTELG